MAINKVNTNWKRLEEFGFKVQFAHRRKYDRSGKNLLPHGGVTAVSVYNPNNGRIYTGIAVCSDTQLYNRKWGRDVAIADAVGHLQYNLIPEEVVKVSLSDMSKYIPVTDPIDTPSFSFRLSTIEEAVVGG